MRTWIAALAAVTVSLGAAPVAAVAETAPAAAQAPDAANAALVKRYLKAVDFERTMDTMIAAMLPVMTNQTMQRSSSLTAEQRQMIGEVVLKVTREKMLPQMIERLVPLYAETYSREELQALVDFYESPLGRSITAKTPGLSPKAAKITQEITPGLMRDVIVEVFERVCPGGKCAPEPKPRVS